jgi:hypothetical protein
MAREKSGLKRFDAWVDRFAKHVQHKGPMPNIEQDERAARTTTNTDR